MVTSSFQLLMQVMRLLYFPYIMTMYTSAEFHEQVYMPSANWLLMIGTVIMIGVLDNVYGVCVMFVTFITTCIVTIMAIVSWRIPSYIVISLFLVFAVFNGTFLLATLVKVPDDAWFTLLLAPSSRPCSSSGASARKTSGRRGYWPATYQPPPSHLHTNSNNNSSNGAPYHTATVFAQFVRKFKVRPAVTFFFHMRLLSLPPVPPVGRYFIIRIEALLTCYSVTLQHGYMDDMLLLELGRDW
ncbi:hypothetical protein VTK56DRAFT_3149 [Thermocarpiscus australiensis]